MVDWHDWTWTTCATAKCYTWIRVRNEQAYEAMDALDSKPLCPKCFAKVCRVSRVKVEGVAW